MDGNEVVKTSSRAISEHVSEHAVDVDHNNHGDTDQAWNKGIFTSPVGALNEHHAILDQRQLQQQQQQQQQPQTVSGPPLYNTITDNNTLITRPEPILPRWNHFTNDHCVDSPSSQCQSTLAPTCDYDYPTTQPTSLPRLPYDPCAHKVAIILIWTLLLFDSAIVPLCLFYVLWYGTQLDPSYIFAITTSIFGVISGVEWVYRSWKLMTHSNLRPLGVDFCPPTADDIRRRPWWQWQPKWSRKYYWGFDAFHWTYTIGYSISLLELIIGSSPEEPWIRLCCSASATFMLYASLVILFPTFWRALPAHWHQPIRFRISSQPPHSSEPIKAAIFTILEDVIAVDTGTGRAWRHAVLARYNASWRFRKFLRDMDLFWGIPALFLSIGIIVVISTHRVSVTYVYGIGWGIPPIWAIIWAGITYIWARIMLIKESREWDRDHGNRGENENEKAHDHGGNATTMTATTVIV